MHSDKKMAKSKRANDSHDSIAGSGLVQLNRSPKHAPTTFRERVTNGPVVDKFFTLGALFGLIGTVGIGVYLWLMLNKILPFASSYPELRHAHVVVQMFLFFGLFVLGFVSQAGGKMLGAELRFEKRPLFMLPVYVVGALGMLAGHVWGAFIVSAAFLFYALYISLVCAKRCERPLHAALVVTGLSILASSPFMSLDSPASALLLMWGGFGTLIFAAGGQFIEAFLGGRNLGGRSGILFLVLHLSSIALLVMNPLAGFNFTPVLALSAVSVYFFRTRVWSWSQSFFRNPLSLAFVCGYIWAFMAWLLYLGADGASADLTVHLLATGWAASLIFAVSAHVVGFITGRDPLLPRKLWWGLLLSWQIVPVGRGVFHALGLPTWFSVLVAMVSVTVMVFWTFALCRAQWRMLRLQAVLTKGEIVKSCG